MRNAIEISKLLNQFTKASEKKYGGMEYATGYFESQIAHLFTLVDEKTQNLIVDNLLRNINQFNDNCNPPSISWTSFSAREMPRGVNLLDVILSTNGGSRKKSR